MGLRVFYGQLLRPKHAVGSAAGAYTQADRSAAMWTAAFVSHTLAVPINARVNPATVKLDAYPGSAVFIGP